MLKDRQRGCRSPCNVRNAVRLSHWRKPTFPEMQVGSKQCCEWGGRDGVNCWLSSARSPKALM